MLALSNHYDKENGGLLILTSFCLKNNYPCCNDITKIEIYQCKQSQQSDNDKLNLVNIFQDFNWQ